MDDVDKAYIAGLFDGEGSIHFKRGVEKKKKHKGGFKYTRLARSRRSLRMSRRKSLRRQHKKHKKTKKTILNLNPTKTTISLII